MSMKALPVVIRSGLKIFLVIISFSYKDIQSTHFFYKLAFVDIWCELKRSDPELVLQLANPKIGYLTGQTIVMDGERYMQ